MGKPLEKNLKHVFMSGNSFNRRAKAGATICQPRMTIAEKF